MLALRLINTYPGLVLVYVALQTPFALFLFTGFIRSVPVELEEAAVIDGCGLYGVFARIVFPLLRPAIATMSVLVSFVIWNDFLQPMLFLTSRDRKTLVVQLFSFVGQYFNDWSPIFAAICLIVYPILILYVVAQKSIIRGMTAGALKG
jgi:raffinose/stachyose/melibiose transport system permease protein